MQRQTLRSTRDWNLYNILLLSASLLLATSLFSPALRAQSAADHSVEINGNEVAATDEAPEQSHPPSSDLILYTGFGQAAPLPEFPETVSEDCECQSSAAATYALRYREYPILVAAFLYFARQEQELYQQVQYRSQNQGVYGHAFISLPDSSGIYSLPDMRSLAHPQGGLAFWRSGSILRGDILVLTHTDKDRETGARDQNNLVFFADQLEGQSQPTVQIPARQGFRLLGLEAKSDAAQNFLASLAQNREAYRENLERRWEDYTRSTWPQVDALLKQHEDWQRDEFGYYYRMVEEGQGDLPQPGEDLNITLERKAFDGQSALSLPIIVGIGRDTLPMPFDYYVGKTPKGSRMEIISPPSSARSNLSRLTTKYGSSRYQPLLDSYAGGSWVHLGFELGAE